MRSHWRSSGKLCGSNVERGTGQMPQGMVYTRERMGKVLREYMREQMQIQGSTCTDAVFCGDRRRRRVGFVGGLSDG